MLFTVEQLVAKLESVRSIIAARFAGRLQLIKSRVDIDDVMQAVAMKAFNGLAACQADNDEQFEHWVLTIAKHTVESLVTAHRSQKRSTAKEAFAIGRDSRTGEGVGDQMIGFTQFAAKTMTPDEILSVREECSAVMSAVDGLGEYQSKVVKMMFVEMKSYEEIASELGVTVSSLRNVVSRAKSRLKDMLQVAV